MIFLIVPIVECPMLKRILIAVGATLLGAARLFAQGPDAANEAPAALPVLANNGAAPAQDGRGWVHSEYLFTWMRGHVLPPLATTGAAGTPRVSAGILGTNGTETLFGDRLPSDLRAGLRIGAGYWFNPEHTLGLELGFMILENRAAIFSAASNDGTILARPYLDARDGSRQAVLVAFPGASNGSLDIRAGSGNFYEGHLGLTEKAYDVGWFRLNSLLGYRFYRHDENLRIQQSISPTSPNIIPGTLVSTTDNFGVRNQFHGIDLGFRSQVLWREFTLEVLTKVAIGRLTRQIDIGGDQTISVPGAAPLVQSGGVLALSSNSGTFHYDDWKTLPEAGVTLNWRIRPNLNARVGYTFMYLDSIARAADQIDVTINPNLFPNGDPAKGGPNRPAFSAPRSYQWIQTLNFGVELTF